MGPGRPAVALVVKKRSRRRAAHRFPLGAGVAAEGLGRWACLWGGPEAEGQGAAGAGGLAGGAGRKGEVSAQGRSTSPGWGLSGPREAGGGVPSSVCVILHLGASLEPHLWEEASWVPTSEQDAWHVARWRATPPPKPFPGSGLFLDAFVQIPRPLTASQVAWF